MPPSDGSNDSTSNSANAAQAETNPASRKQTQTVAFLAVAALSVACVLFLVWFLLAERIPVMTEESVAAAEKLWDANGPASYDMDITIRGAQPGQVHIEVRDDKVTAMTRDNLAPPDRTWDTWTVPGMFNTLDQEFALATNPDHENQAAPGSQVWLRCQFDPKVGYPAVYHRVMTGGGPEVYWQVTKFEPK
jgi:Family of unknown function (DUF6174)